MDLINDIRKIPPVTRFLCLSTVAVSVPVIANLVSAHDVVFVKDFVTQKLQLWRIPTSFFLAGALERCSRYTSANTCLSHRLGLQLPLRCRYAIVSYD
jgi:hypothetical protein